MANDYDEILRKCRSALRLRFDHAFLPQAESCFDAERNLIEERGFSNVLVQAVEFATEQEQHGRACHLIGSGCSSMINYLLSLSEVDPIQNRTFFQRFWMTSDDTPPIFQFVVSPAENEMATEISVPENVSVHPMTPLEQIPVIIERKFPQIRISMNDHATFNTITAGNTDGVFQFEIECVRKLAARIRPRRIDDLAVVTALAVIECADPNVVAEYIAHSPVPPTAGHQQRNRETGTNWSLDSEAALFQEALLSVLYLQVGLTWSDSWRFILDSMKHRIHANHPLWEEAVRKAADKTRNEIDADALIEALSKASRTATCRAHHVANAITSYRAAFFQTHYRAVFDSLALI